LVRRDIHPPILASRAHRQILDHLVRDVGSGKMLGVIMLATLDSSHNTTN
jgi:hypothetical protein